MTNKIIVLGAGLVGSAIAIDLSHDHEVTSADINQDALNKFKNSPKIRTVQVDLNQPEAVKNLVVDFDLVIGAVPGFMGFQTLKTVIEAGKNIVDISFMPEDFLQLDKLAKKNRRITTRFQQNACCFHHS